MFCNCTMSSGLAWVYLQDSFWAPPVQRPGSLPQSWPHHRRLSLVPSCSLEGTLYSGAVGTRGSSSHTSKQAFTDKIKPDPFQPFCSLEVKKQKPITEPLGTLWVMQSGFELRPHQTLYSMQIFQRLKSQRQRSGQ